MGPIRNDLLTIKMHLSNGPQVGSLVGFLILRSHPLHSKIKLHISNGPQEMLGSLVGFLILLSCPLHSKIKLHLIKWTRRNVRVIIWILNYIEPSIVLNLRPYQTAADR